MKKYLKFSAFLLPWTLVSILSFNNCGRYGALEESSQGSTSLGSLGSLNEELSSEKLGLPVALLSAEQTLASMMRVTNQTTTSTTLATEYRNRYGALAAGNDLNLVNSPLMLGSTSLAGEVCNSLLAQEKSLTDTTRVFFNGINFAAGVSTLSDAAFNGAIRGMARSFWGRHETAEELGLLQLYKTEFSDALSDTVRTQAASTSNLMLGTCAAMLSSLDAISY